VVSKNDPTNGVGQALDAEPYHKQFIEAMDDDFNTPQALATIFDLARAINQAGDSGLSFLKAKGILARLAVDVLGLKLESFGFIRLPDPAVEPFVVLLVEARHSLRKAKQWQLADEIRNKLDGLGILLEDDRGHTVTLWRRDYRGPVPQVESLVDLLVKVYFSCKEAKQWQLADEIRDKLDKAGVVLEDTPTGTVWKRKR
jgi:cysteinyl-tRNA synthetase